MLGASFIAVVALVAGLLVWKATSNQGPGTEGPTPTADDGVDRTVGLLREKDPVCDDWLNYADKLAAATKQWGEINKGIPASQWTFEQRAVVASAADAMTTASDQFESILPRAQDPVLQELIAQTIVYWRAYLQRIPTYVDQDGKLAGVAANFGGAATYMCTAVPLVPASNVGGGENTAASAPQSAALEPFMTILDPRCDVFIDLADHQNSVLAGWAATNPLIPAAQWTPAQRRLSMAAKEVMTKDSEQARKIAESTVNPIFANLLFTYGAYVQAYADAIPTYTPDDNQLWRVATYLGGGMKAACEAQP